MANSSEQARNEEKRQIVRVSNCCQSKNKMDVPAPRVVEQERSEYHMTNKPITRSTKRIRTTSFRCIDKPVIKDDHFLFYRNEDIRQRQSTRNSSDSHMRDMSCDSRYTTRQLDLEERGMQLRKKSKIVICSSLGKAE